MTLDGLVVSSYSKLGGGKGQPVPHQALSLMRGSLAMLERGALEVLVRYWYMKMQKGVHESLDERGLSSWLFFS